ncbi:MAG: SIR2 family protein [Alphaproteobacteria bacterium]
MRPPWPYDWQALDRALNIKTIESQGEHLLHRALNIKRLVAFVGSGVSMAYGRVAWSELARLHVETMIDLLSYRREQNDELGALLRYITDLKDRPDELYGDGLYAALQACEQIWQLVASWEEDREEDREEDTTFQKLAESFGFDWKEEEQRFGERLLKREKRGSYLFRSWIKRETYDELPHAKRLIRGWQVTSSEPKESSGDRPKVTIEALEKRWIPKCIRKAYESLVKNGEEADRAIASALRELTGSRRLLRGEVGKQRQDYLIFFKRPFLKALEKASKTLDTRPELADLVKVFRDVSRLRQTALNDRNYLRPVRGFAVGLALDIARLIETLESNGNVLPSPEKSCDEPIVQSPTASESTEIEKRQREKTEIEKRQGKKYVRRSEQIPPDHDPMHGLAYGLGIKRFLTTNYDLEIERLFVNMGFETQEGVDTDGPEIDDVEMVGPAGGRTRDLVLTERSAIDLVDFAASDPPYEFQVVHLHGRATEKHDIVVTEADYQRTYVGETANQTAFKEGIEIAFGGNPILFLGLSLSEGDVLRPLREFMTDSSRRNRSVIALRDGREGELKRQNFARTAYSRHGVHVIHYGRVTSRGNNEEQPYWLDKMHAAIKTFVAEIEALANLIEVGTKQKSMKEANDESETSKAERRRQARNAIKGIESALKAIKKIKFKIRETSVDAKRAWSVLDRDFESDGARCDIFFEVRILQALQKLTPAVARLGNAEWVDPGQREGHCRAVASFLRVCIRSAAERAETAIVTAALNAKLGGLKKSWSDWWRKWRAVPRSRSEDAKYEPLKGDQPIWGRHLGTEENSKQAEKSVVLDHFLATVPRTPLGPRRRIFLLIGARGSGKGSVFNAFTQRGKEMLRGPTGKPSGKTYAAQFFATFSFSIEIASVWDALLGFLDDPRRNPNLLRPLTPLSGENGKAPEDAQQRRDALKSLPRVDALRRELSELDIRLAGMKKELPSDAVRRILVVFNAFDILLDEGGEPKNGEIGRIADLLLGPISAGAPLDLVLICRDSGLPSRYRIPKAKKAKVDAGEDVSHEPACSPPLTLLLSKEQEDFGRTDPRAASIAYADGRPPYVYRELVAVLRKSEALIRPLESVPASVASELGIAIDEKGKKKKKSAKLAEDYLHVLELPDPRKFDWPPFEKVKESLYRCTAAAINAADPMTVDTKKAIADDLSLVRLFDHHLERRRFLYTLVVAVAHRIEMKKISKENKSRELTAFLQRIIFTVRGPGISVQDRVIEIILDYWFDELSATKRKSTGTAAIGSTRDDPILCESLLRHLAVIGTPVKAEVLAICPEVRRHLLFLKETTKLQDKYFTRAVTRTMEEIVARGLAFRVRQPGSGGGPGELDHRYVVHRTVQRYVFRKLGSQRLEPSEGQLFTISLYTSQQRELPRLSAAAYEFINELVDVLSAYPSSRPSVHDIDTESTPQEKRNLASLALRAALGATRNLFSLGIVSRFSDLGGVHVTKPGRLGYLEHHRLFVRWLFDYAAHLYPPLGPRKSTGGSNEWPPFYRDELVWLANECGVFAHAQGQTYDASALFWLARRIARAIEGLGPGVMRVRILLNDAWCSIDRARLDDAEARFRGVLATADEEAVLRHVATGGLALLDHLRGRIDAAKKGYAAAILGLQHERRTRPLAEFQRNLGDLERHMGNHAEAERELLKSVQIGEAGGYMELVHLAQVARVRNFIEEGSGDPIGFTEILNEAHAYAEKMDLPRLLCEVLMVRALMLVKHGHSVVAGQIVTRAIRIATLSGLMLRKIAYLELLARIERVRGGMDSAERLRTRTIQSAHHVGYNLTVERAERARDEILMLPPDMHHTTHETSQ